MDEEMEPGGATARADKGRPKAHENKLENLIIRAYSTNIYIGYERSKEPSDTQELISPCGI